MPESTIKALNIEYAKNVFDKWGVEYSNYYQETERTETSREFAFVNQ